MPGPFVIDASVFLNAFNPLEAGHDDSRRLLEYLQELGVPLIAPVLLLPEAAAAIARGCGDSDRARRFASTLAQLPHLVLVPLEATLAQMAVKVAADHHLRGSDAVYAAVALRFGAQLVTLDREQHDRVAPALATRYPVDVCREIGI